MGNLYTLIDTKIRPISPENFNGAKGGGCVITGQGSIRQLADGLLTANS